MYRPHWIRFTWDLAKLPDERPSSVVRGDIRLAEKEDLDTVVKVLVRSVREDHAWGLTVNDKVKELETTIAEGMESGNIECWLLVDGRIVAASAVVTNPESPRQLTSGICVLNEYRCRGVGHMLLHQSLSYLKEKGLKEASVITRSNLPAAKFLYPKFDSTSEEVKELLGIVQNV